ncbi:MAG: SUF system NifU family Fe-S cluster assembly protein [Candidatus Azosocius agrarius]|nr:MAG: SUF system NifU family Fe-S cluster assembly protein [Gammaproteobacteria bacterium]
MDINELYKEIIIDHGTNPRNYKILPISNYTYKGFNPICGDSIHIYIYIKNNTINNISFQGKGCAISIASASIMTEEFMNKNINFAIKSYNLFQKYLLLNDSTDIKNDKLNALSGIRNFPSRIKCVTLAWYTFKTAIKNNNK